MPPIHLSVSALGLVGFAAELLIVMFLLRVAAAHLGDSALGKGLGAIIG